MCCVALDELYCGEKLLAPLIDLPWHMLVVAILFDDAARAATLVTLFSMAVLKLAIEASTPAGAAGDTGWLDSSRLTA